MKSINVTELKANLSKYLRIASRGTRVLVKDRDEPVAQLAPPDPEPGDWRQQLARDGRLRLGSQDWSRLKITRPRKAVDIQASLQAVRDDTR